jgi:hypothetical protein
MLQALADGRAEDFGEVERYAARTPGRWTSHDDRDFQKAFRSYMEYGFANDRSNCDSTDDLEHLADELSRIARDYDPPIRSRIESLYGDIEERRFKEPEAEVARPTPWQPEASSAPDDLAAVKSMFQTLLV